jgi:hypothetical protein
MHLKLHCCNVRNLHLELFAVDVCVCVCVCVFLLGNRSPTSIHCYQLSFCFTSIGWTTGRPRVAILLGVEKKSTFCVRCSRQLSFFLETNSMIVSDVCVLRRTIISLHHYLPTDTNSLILNWIQQEAQ